VLLPTVLASQGAQAFRRKLSSIRNRSRAVIRIIVWNDAMGVRTFEARPSAKRLSSRGRSSSPLLLPRQRSLSGYHGSKASVFSRRSLTMFAADFYRQLGAASVQCWYRGDALQLPDRCVRSRAHVIDRREGRSTSGSNTAYTAPRCPDTDRSPRRRLNLPAMPPSDISTLHKHRHLNLVATSALASLCSSECSAMMDDKDAQVKRRRASAVRYSATSLDRRAARCRTLPCSDG
jgi:hypothetical protein